MQANRITAYRVAVRDSHQNDIETTGNLLPSLVAGAIKVYRQLHPDNFIFVYKVQVDKSEELVAIVEPGNADFIESFERYEILPDNRVQISCEFGSWIYGGSWRSGRDNEQRARGVVSTMRHTQYWKTVSQFDISREQD